MKKTILVTGAGSGIGKDTSLTLAKRGHHVIAATHGESDATALREELAAVQFDVSMEVIRLDITLPEDLAKIEQYDLDVLINVAGIAESGSLAEVPMDRVRKNFDVNVFGTIEATQIALKGMMKKKKGTIIVVSSVAGRIPVPFLNPYSMTKFALSGGMAALRAELHRVAKDVHLVLIEPGAYHTGLNQRAFNTKYEWMNEKSYFYKLIPALKKEESTLFKKIEEKSTEGIVRKIVKAAEADKPKLRYVAPFYQSLAVSLARIAGI